MTHFGRRSVRTRRDPSVRGTPAVEVLDVESLNAHTHTLINNIRALPKDEEVPEGEESYLVPTKDQSRLGLIKV